MKSTEPPQHRSLLPTPDSAFFARGTMGILSYAIVTSPTDSALRRRRAEILAHGHVRPASPKAKQNVNGFRFFAVDLTSLWTICDCGWRPDLGLHYRPAPLRPGNVVAFKSLDQHHIISEGRFDAALLQP